ncbi:MAG: DUF4250 domain-containing protein [Hungatella sp.]|nr:DUF4250 domain-containing protein [Hungatella sp.]
MNQLPKDPVMMLSYLNTRLRDFYPSLEDCCKSLSLDRQDIEDRLAQIDYRYDPEKNQFV